MKNSGVILAMSVACIAMAGCAGIGTDSRAQANERWQQTRADILIGKGEQQFSSGDLNGAGSSAKEALSLSPGSPTALMLLGRVHIEQGQYAKALKVLNEVEQVRPGTAEIPYLMAVVFERRGRYDQALRLFEKARAIDGENPAYVMASAEVMVSLGQGEEALGLIESKLISLSESAGMFVMAGDLAMTVDRPTVAVGHYREARTLDPDDSQILAKLAKALYFAGQYDRAMSALDQLAGDETFQRSAWVQIMRGDSALAMGKARSAKAAYSRATEIDPKKAQYWSKLATASLMCDDLPRTVMSARRALSLDDQLTDASIALGYALLAQGKAEQAYDVLARAEKAHPGDAMIKCLLARCHSSAGRDELANRYYKATLQLDPKNAVARQVLAQNEQ